MITNRSSKTDRIAAAMELGAGWRIKKPYILSQLAQAPRKELERPSEDGQRGGRANHPPPLSG